MMFRTHTASALAIFGLAMTAHSAALAQEQEDEQSNDVDVEETLDEVVVVGSRDTIQRSIEIKRNSEIPSAKR